VVLYILNYLLNFRSFKYGKRPDHLFAATFFSTVLVTYQVTYLLLLMTEITITTTTTVTYPK